MTESTRTTAMQAGENGPRPPEIPTVRIRPSRGFVPLRLHEVWEYREFACFHSVEELVDKAQYYLRNEDERAAIANAGRQRTLREHTYVHRFNEVFQHVGLPSLPLSAILEGKVNPGRVQEVC